MYFFMYFYVQKCRRPGTFIRVNTVVENIQINNMQCLLLYGDDFHCRTYHGFLANIEIDPIPGYGVADI